MSQTDLAAVQPPPAAPSAAPAVRPAGPRLSPWAGGLATAALLVAILALAAALRFAGPNWDDGQMQHPDERFIVMVTDALALPGSPLAFFDTATSPLNPYNRGFDGFAYGTLPVFIVKALALALGLHGMEDLTLLGRRVSAASDLLTVLLVFLLGSRVFDRRAGLLAALFSACTVLQIQLAHFYTVDSFLGTFTALTLLFAYRTWQRGSLVDAAIMGVALGLAGATKISAAVLIPFVGLACLLPWQASRIRPREGAWTLLLVAGLGAAVALRVAEPYAFLGPSPFGVLPNPQFVDDMRRWVEISTGQAEVPFMIQWARTPAYTYALQILVRWGMGVPLGLAALAGVGLGAAELLRWPRHARNLLLVGFSALCLAYFGAQFAKFLRYMIPAYPALAVLAAYALLRLWDASGRARLAPPRLARGGAALAIAVVIGYSAWYAGAFTSLYLRPHSRILASEWIYTSIPPGATLGVEHWDDQLPLRLRGEDTQQYRYVTLALYDEESPKKAADLAGDLDRVDYVILASYRLAGSIPRLPERYPLATQYYHWLFDGELGFQQVAEFQQRPSLFGLSIDDSHGPEDLTVYEHPTVLIFRKTERYSPQHTRALFATVDTSTAMQIPPVRAGQGVLLLSPDQADAVESAGTWSALYHRDSFTNQLPLLAWLLLLEAIGVLAFPLVWRLLPNLPDRGWTVTKVLALVAVAYVGWLLQSLGLAPFGQWTLLLGLLVIAGASLLVVRRAHGAFGRWLRARRGGLLLGEAVFLVGFALLLAIRLANPDLWQPSYGGEKPMDFAYFNAVLKSAVFPPYDPWFAGGYINYYYYGFVLAAVPTKLLGIVPAVAYNLVIPTFYGLLCAAAYGFVSAVVLPRPRLAGREGRALALVAALAAPIFLALLGDLDGMLQLVEGFARLGHPLVGSVLPVVGTLFKVLGGVPAWLGGAELPAFDFWRPTRVIGPENPGPITEFPFFTFLYGDLHAHLLALPLTVTVLVVALNAARMRPRIRRVAARRDLLPLARTLAPSVALLALLVGTLRATNTWDFPVYLVLAGLGLALAVRPRDWRAWELPALSALGLLAAVYLGASLLFQPYLSHYQLFYTGFDPAPAHTRLGQFLTVHGLNLYLVVSALALEALLIQLARRGITPAWGAGRALGVALPAPPVVLPASVPAYAALSLLSVAAALYLAGWETAALLFVSGALLPLVFPARLHSSAGLLTLGMVALALLALLLPEVVTLQGDVGRMNTVFKFHLQAWVLLALAGAIGLAFVARRARRLPPDLWVWRDLWAAVLLVLLLSAATYPLLGTSAKTSLRFPDPPAALTLDGMAYMATAQYTDRKQDLALPDDYRAIRWMQDTIPGTPTIAEGQAPLYHWGARVSIYTGLPGILGWDWHQRQQRWGYQWMIDARLRDVKTLYESASMADAWPILERYRVRYIYVGGLERAYYPPAGLDKFEQAVGHGLGRVYRQGTVTIYRVDAEGRGG